MRDLRPNFIETYGFLAIGPSELDPGELLERMKTLEFGEILSLADKELIQWPGARMGIRARLTEEVRSWPVEAKLGYLLRLFDKSQMACEEFKLFWGHHYPWPNFMKFYGLTVYSIPEKTRAVDIFVKWGLKFNKDLQFPISVA